MKKYCLGVIGCLILICFSVSDFGQTKAAFPKQSGPINDIENDLDLGSIAALKKRVDAHKVKTGEQILVVTVANYSPYKSLSEYAKALAQNWGMGNNAVLVVYSEAKNEANITAGSGLQKKLTEDVCRKIIISRMFPKFKEGNFDQGLIDGVAEIIKTLNP